MRWNSAEINEFVRLNNATLACRYVFYIGYNR